MGWTSHHATNYKKNGTIDRKTECDAYFMEGLNAGFYNVRKSAIVGSVYYAAIEALKRYKRDETGHTVKDSAGNEVIEDIPQAERRAFAAVFLTATDSKDYFNFSYKDMDESMGPAYYDCPLSILNLLSPTESEWANEWRAKCKKAIEDKRNPHALKNLPIGAVIRYKRGNETIEAVKHAPAYQFKRPFWYLPDQNVYVPQKRIPELYEVVAV